MKTTIRQYDIADLRAEINHINSLDITNIEFLDKNGEELVVSEEFIAELRFMGLSTFHLLEIIFSGEGFHDISPQS